jgi:hypothetical protein
MTRELSYDVAHERYPLPAWAQRFAVRVDHSPARWWCARESDVDVLLVHGQ